MRPVTEESAGTFLCPTCGSGSDWRAVAVAAACPACGHEFERRDGVWLLGEAGRDDDYPPEACATIARIEGRHFWFRARRRVIRSVLRAIATDATGRRALEIGCGTGQLLELLERAGWETVGLDMHIERLRLARRRAKALLIRADGARPLFDGVFDLVLLCDVLEHAEDDHALLSAAVRATKPGGHILVTVPAGQWLWGQLDVLSGHRRRYTRAALRNLLESAGTKLRLMRYFHCVIAPLIFLRRRLWRAGEREGAQLSLEELRVPPPPINALLGACSAAERFIARLMPLPWGASLMALARRPTAA